MKSLAKIIFWIYLLVLVWLIIFKLSLNIEAFLDNHQVGSINLTPFAASGGKREIILNILAFLPFGIFWSTAYKQSSGIYKFLMMVLLSLVMEGAQYVFAIGAADITDVISNGSGALAGLVLYGFLRLILGEKVTDGLVVVSGGLVLGALVYIQVSHAIGHLPLPFQP